MGPVGQYIYEPDGAVVRAGLVTAVAAAVDGWLLDPRIAYVTAAKYVATPLASAYEVVEELPYKEKALRSWVRRPRTSGGSRSRSAVWTWTQPNCARSSLRRVRRRRR